MLNTSQMLANIEKRELVREIVQVEPEVKKMLLEVASLPPNPEMHHWSTYTELKQMFSPYVGWKARNSQLATERHYKAFIDFLDAIIPDDEYNEVA